MWSGALIGIAIVVVLFDVLFTNDRQKTRGHGGKI